MELHFQFPSKNKQICTLEKRIYFASFSAVKRIGCFKDKSRRAIPGVDGRAPLLTGYYRRRFDSIRKCALFTLMYGFRVFAIQNQGWCATGPRAHVTYRKYGRSNRCSNGKGGPWANDVYMISGKCFVLFVRWFFINGIHL